MKRVAAGVHLLIPWLFELTKRPDDRAVKVALCLALLDRVRHRSRFLLGIHFHRWSQCIMGSEAMLAFVARGSASSLVDSCRPRRGHNLTTRHDANSMTPKTGCADAWYKTR